MPFHIKQAYLRRVVEELDRFSADGHVRAIPPPPNSVRSIGIGPI
jgi:adenosine deaminase